MITGSWKTSASPIPDQEIGDFLLGQIRGSGAFGRFKNAIYRYGIEQDWFQFKAEAYKDIAIAWLDRHGLAYVDDMKREAQSD